MVAPKKVYVEVTTHCNLQCQMCVKYAEGSCIHEGDMSLDVFRSLCTGLQQVEELVLNGIGEPLLHPQLVTMVQLARKQMPESGSIGFQSNGLLLDQRRADELLAAGVDTVCLSLDQLEEVQPDQQGKGHTLPPVARAIQYLNNSRQKRSRPFRLGLEVVVSSENIAQLPLVVAWAAKHSVDYILVSHMYSYDGQQNDRILFSPSTSRAVEVYTSWQNQGISQGLDLRTLPEVRLKFGRTKQDRELLRMGSAMQREARDRGARLHLHNLFEYDPEKHEQAAVFFKEAEELAHTLGLEVHLPPLFAHEEEERHCLFIQDEAMFIDYEGNVTPCHFLWHNYSCQVNMDRVQVEQRSFGHVLNESLQTIWQKSEYIAFREEANAGQYSTCWSCTPGPCASLMQHNAMDIRDCHGSQVPCGHCMWSIGWTRCL